MGLADILRKHGQPYLDTHALPVVQDTVWRAIVACCTQSLGGHIECCDRCGSRREDESCCRCRIFIWCSPCLTSSTDWQGAMRARYTSYCSVRWRTR
ncbi:transposase zinc-binding domain-containing protein [Candidatus Nitrotoga sp. BS]|uniref:transposase zinc-binding domain-containing protein n=1 Tax=Candidatus Nitrotoga sp. BS TaxID=2890408 RepID=UPI00403DAAA1